MEEEEECYSQVEYSLSPPFLGKLLFLLPCWILPYLPVSLSHLVLHAAGWAVWEEGGEQHLEGDVVDPHLTFAIPVFVQTVEAWVGGGGGDYFVAL